MVTSKTIISKLKKGDISSLQYDLQVLFNSNDDKCQCSDVCNILNAVYYLMSADEKTKKDECDNLILKLVTSINLCMDYIKINFAVKEMTKHQFLPICYHIVTIYLKFELYFPALYAAGNLKIILSEQNDKEKFSSCLSALFWNEALRVEKEHVLKDFTTGFKLRCQAVEFIILQNKFSDIKDKTSLTLLRYCSNIKEKDPNEIICFMRSMWEQITGENIDYDHKLYLFSVLNSWFKVLLKYFKNLSILKFLLSLMLDLSNDNGDQDDNKSICKACLDISKVSIQIFLLSENVPITTKDLLKYKKISSSDRLDLVAYMCSFFYFSFIETLNTENLEKIILIKSYLDFCTTLVLHYLDFFSYLEAQKDLCFDPNSDVTISHALVNIFTAIIKNEQNTTQRQTLIKEAQAFIQLSTSKLERKHLTSELQKKLLSYAKAIGNIGYVLYNYGLYSESAYFLEINCELVSKHVPADETDDKKYSLWKKRELLIYCYFLSGNHKMALQYVVKSLLLHKDKRKECMELWHKVKRDALRTSDTTISSSTISDVMSEMKLSVSAEEEISFLLQELKGCKSERCCLKDETISVVEKLFSLPCYGINRAYVILETLTMAPSISKKVSLKLNKSLLDMCVESIDLFKDHISKNPASNEVKLLLSINYVWLYCLKLKQLHKVAKKETEVCLKSTSDDEESENCDINPAFPLVTFLVEAETINSLELALELWTDISKESSNSWAELADVIKDWDLLTIIEATAELFSISVYDDNEFKTWLLLQAVASAVGNEEHKLNSSISLINFLVKMGYLEMASRFLKLAQAAADFDVECNTELKISKLKLQLAKSNFCLHTGKFDEGLQLLCNVFDNPIFEEHTKSVKILQIQSLMLQSKFLSVPPSAFIDIQNLKYFEVHTAISSAIECTSLAKKLLKIITEKQSSETFRDWISFKTLLLQNILKTHLLLGEHYFQIGDPRFARCILKEGLKVAEEHLLTHWSSKILIVLGQLDLLCNNLDDCTVKLNGLKYIMDEDSKENASVLLSKAYDKTLISESLNISDEYIIPGGTGLNLKRVIRQNFINNYDVQSSPLSTKQKKTSKFEVKLESYSNGNKFPVYLINLEIWALSCLHLIAEGNTSLAEAQLKKLLQRCEVLKDSNTISNALSFVKIDLAEKDLHRVSSVAEVMLLCSILLRLSLLYFSKGKVKETEYYLDCAFKTLSESSEYEKYLYPKMFSLLKYHKTVIALKHIIGIKPDACLAYNICPSVVPNAVFTKRILKSKNSTVINMETPHKKNPQVLLIPCSNERSNCPAPVKKDILPAHLKKDIEELTYSNTVTPLIFSSSDDELFSKSPLLLAPKKGTRKNLKTSYSKKNSENVKYKMFKSKNSDLNIQSSCDIWKFSSLATPKNTKKTIKSQSVQGELKSLRQTRQMARAAKSDSSSKLVMKNSKQTEKLHRNTKKASTVKDSSVECIKDTSGDMERRTSIEYYRGTSKNRIKQNTIESNLSEGDVFYSECADETLQKEKLDTPQLSSIGKVPFSVDELCRDLDCIGISRHKENKLKVTIPDDKLTELITELDQIRLLVQNNAPYPLYVNICKLLAVLMMNKYTDTSKFQLKALDFSFLLSETFSSTLQQIYLSYAFLFNGKAEKCDVNCLYEVFKRGDMSKSSQMEYLLSTIPKDYTVVQITPLFNKEQEVISSGSKYTASKFIICRYQRNSPPLVMCIDSSSEEMFNSSVFKEFENILLESRIIMKKNDDIKMWWKTRSILDKRLQTLVKNMEDKWFGCWKGLLLSISTNEERTKHLKKISNILCEMAEPSDRNLLQVLLDSTSFLSREQISTAVCLLWNCKPFEEIYSQVYKSILDSTAKLPETKRHPLILVLDQNIQEMPWENLPILNGVPVSRMPSLNIMISKLTMSNENSNLHKGIDSANTYYILNPGGDLKNSQDFFQPIFEKHTDWKGIIGKAPDAQEYASAFKNSDLLVYCGHGSGRQYLEGIAVDRMKCHAATILMGCSSGQLKQLGKQLEAYGVPLTYLMNGCPCVVGNLWDVTDKDIDRFTDKLLELFVPNYNKEQNCTDIVTAVSQARNTCKMPYLVGAAPIVYGFPVFARK